MTAHEAVRKGQNMIGNSSQKLKPCPYCDSEDTHIIWSSDYYHAYAACGSCLKRGPIFAEIDDAIMAWNNLKELK